MLLFPRREEFLPLTPLGTLSRRQYFSPTAWRDKCAQLSTLMAEGTHQQQSKQMPLLPVMILERSLRVPCRSVQLRIHFLASGLNYVPWRLHPRIPVARPTVRPSHPAWDATSYDLWGTRVLKRTLTGLVWDSARQLSLHLECHAR